ncbi:sensor histidine kinase [Streptomyces varsoviensis]|uniref:sensor histidine kinase n=1 Tax=Streptomyces varsoviensis TaxID=67373 RepID=UPI0033FAAB01
MDNTGKGPVSGGPEGDSLRWARGWRRMVLAAGMLVYPCVTAVGAAQYATGARAAAGYGVVAAFACCYVLAARSAARHAWRPLGVLLGVMTALFVAELPIAREYAFFLCAVVVSFAAAFLKRHAVLIVAAGAVAALVVPWAVRPWHGSPGWFEAIAVVFTALTVYGFSEIAAANRALLEARAEVARLASEAERARIARDLHDLLGHSLTVITVKSALARRLTASGSPRSLDEITEVESLSRQALTDVRAAVSGYRDVTLAGEIARGRELLRAAGVLADLPAATDMVDGAHQELFGWVVREGLTNVVRHARATRCVITLSASHVEIRDDGVGGAAAYGHGHGLDGLRERVAAAGGAVTAGPAAPGGWRLRVALDRVSGDAGSAYEAPSSAAGAPAPTPAPPDPAPGTSNSAPAAPDSAPGTSDSAPAPPDPARTPPDPTRTPDDPTDGTPA